MYKKTAFLSVLAAGLFVASAATGFAGDSCCPSTKAKNVASASEAQVIEATALKQCDSRKAINASNEVCPVSGTSIKQVANTGDSGCSSKSAKAVKNVASGSSCSSTKSVVNVANTEGKSSCGSKAVKNVAAGASCSTAKGVTSVANKAECDPADCPPSACKDGVKATGARTAFVFTDKDGNTIQPTAEMVSAINELLAKMEGAQKMKLIDASNSGATVADAAEEGDAASAYRLAPAEAVLVDPAENTEKAKECSSTCSSKKEKQVAAQDSTE